MKQKTLDIKEYELPITIKEEKEGGFTAQCSVWNDCYAQADTIEKVITEISSVASSLIELYGEENIKIPLKLKRTAKKESKRFSLNVPLVVSIN